MAKDTTITFTVFALPALFALYLGVQTPEKKQVEIKVEPTKTAEEKDEPPSTPVKIETKEQIENYIKEKFGASAETMLAIAKCESGLNPSAKNSRSTASGVFQIIKGTWQGNTEASWDERFDAKTNIDTAFTIWSHRGTQPWKCGKII